MNALTPVDLLQSFPVLLYVWSVFVLVWGVGVLTMVYRLSKKTSMCRPTVLRQSDKYTVLLVALVNVFLLGYLAQFELANECTSWITVVNVFYTTHLTYMSIDLTRWWSSVKRCHRNFRLI